MVGLNYMKKILLITVLMLLGLVSSAQKQSENGFTDIITPDTILNKFMMYWLRKPYKLGGNTEKGIDCSQFNKRLYMDVYGSNLENVCYKQWNQTGRIKKDSLQVGDLLFFRSKASPSGWHCGVYIGNTYFVHAANRYEGVKVSSLSEPTYNKNFRGGGRAKF
jgi:lipoprotein Spr